MKLLEIKNNLVKLAYSETESPVLGRFIVLATTEKSYVAQFVNLKSDNVNNFAIAKLLFTFTPDGVVDNYDGSVPDITAELSFLNSDELLNLLPVETPVKFGQLAQQDDILNLDISIFEHNLTVFAERELDKSTFISNCVRQLFQMKEKCVIIDRLNNFSDYPKMRFSKDFKLPLNSDMIDYLFEYELSEVDTNTKAVIQDIFYTIQQYIKSLDFEFLPIDNFVNVVANQYKETQMPELALLKNKLLKYRDANVFANTKEEVLAFSEKIKEKNCSIVDISEIHDSLQKEVIRFIHKELEKIDKYIYFFCPLEDDNSDKKLLRQLINNNHVFTSIIVSSTYKYEKELKACAENIILFAPKDIQHDFAGYNTFLNKLNLGECIICGKLTQGIPFIIDMTDLELDLTKDDVLGDKYQFVPVPENLEMIATEDADLSSKLDNTVIPESPSYITPEESEDISVQSVPNEDAEETEFAEIEEESDDTIVAQNEEEEEAPLEEEVISPDGDIVAEYAKIPQDKPVEGMIEPVKNIFEDTEDLSVEDLESEELSLKEESLSLEEELEENDYNNLTEEDLNYIENNNSSEENSLTNDDDETIDTQTEQYIEEPYDNEQPPVVPVYPAEEESMSQEEENSEDIQYAQGDAVTHPRYGRGVIEKIIKYGNKTLCSITFENVGRRLLDPSISEFTKI